jgi:8-oxo-dGTP pyrophosphatase MutT (NUDIX family)
VTGVETVSAETEIVTIVDESNNVIGAATRRDMRARRLPHRAAYIMVFHPRGSLYVQKRTATKDVYPGYYDVAAGGVVTAGESYLESAVRELEEEMGIRGVPLGRLFDFYHTEGGHRVWGRAYSCVYDGEIVLQEEEVESGAFHPVHEILRRAEDQPFTPDGLYVLRRFLGQGE